MYARKKGNRWYFGIKAHIGMDAASGMAHSSHVSNIAKADVLLHG